MNASEIITLFDYNTWATARILQAAARLEPEQFVVAPQGYSGDLRSILVHTMSVDRLWRIRMETGSTPEHLQAQAFPTVAALEQRWGQEQQAMSAYLAALNESMMEEPVRFRRFSDELTQPFIRWQLLMQCILHGMSHRSEAAAILTVYDQSPGDLDFFFFVLEQGNG